jgi:hypothetical protein
VPEQERRQTEDSGNDEDHQMIGSCCARFHQGLRPNSPDHGDLPDSFNARRLSTRLGPPSLLCLSLSARSINCLISSSIESPRQRNRAFKRTTGDSGSATTTLPRVIVRSASPVARRHHR